MDQATKIFAYPTGTVDVTYILQAGVTALAWRELLQILDPDHILQTGNAVHHGFEPVSTEVLPLLKSSAIASNS